MASSKCQIHALVDPGLYKRLYEMAKAEDRPVTRIIIRALEAYLESHKLPEVELNKNNLTSN